MKSLFASRTFWLALIQAGLGVFVIFDGTYPNVGIFAIGKSILDVILRVLTTEPVRVV